MRQLLRIERDIVQQAKDAFLPEPINGDLAIHFIDIPAKGFSTQARRLAMNGESFGGNFEYLYGGTSSLV